MFPFSRPFLLKRRDSVEEGADRWFLNVGRSHLSRWSDV
jgi:hypothetical protein